MKKEGIPAVTQLHRNLLTGIPSSATLLGKTSVRHFVFGRPQPHDPLKKVRDYVVEAEMQMARKHTARVTRPTGTSVIRRRPDSDQAGAKFRRLMNETEEEIGRLERDQHVTQELLELEVSI